MTKDCIDFVIDSINVQLHNETVDLFLHGSSKEVDSAEGLVVCWYIPVVHDMSWVDEGCRSCNACWVDADNVWRRVMDT